MSTSIGDQVLAKTGKTVQDMVVDVTPISDGQKAVVQYLHTVKLPEKIATMEGAADARNQFYIDEADIEYLQSERKLKLKEFYDIPEIAENVAKLKVLHGKLYKEQVLANDRKMPRIPPEGSMSREYNALQGEIEQAKEVWYGAEIVPFDNRIANINHALQSGGNMRRLEQKEWDAGRKEE
jgi:hypothetical protein